MHLLGSGDSDMRGIQSRDVYSGWSMNQEKYRIGEPLKRALTDLFKKFEDSPVLLCSDVVSFSTGSLNSVKGFEDDWALRRYADVWCISTKLTTAGVHRIPNPRHPVTYRGYERYRTSEALIKRLLEVSLTATWKSTPPTEPFAHIPLDAFEIGSQQPASHDAGSLPLDQSGWLHTLSQRAHTPLRTLDPVVDLDADDFDNRSFNVDNAHPLSDTELTLPRYWPVDGKPSCSAFFECALPPIDGSVFCMFHALAALLPRPGANAPGLAATELTRCDIPRGSNLHLDFLWLRGVAKASPTSVWLIDFEFFNLAGDRSPIPWSIGIRDFNGRLLLAECIDYDGASVDDLCALARPHMLRPDTPLEALTRCADRLRFSVQRHYGGNLTHGKSITSVRKAILELGYSPQTHVVLSYGTTLDMQLFLRILAGDDSAIVRRMTISEDDRRTLQPVNVLRFARKMVGGLPQYRLEVVHRALCPSSTVIEYHTAAADTLAMLEVMNVLFGDA